MDRRKPHKTISVKTAQNKRTIYEIFEADQWRNTISSRATTWPKVSKGSDLNGMFRLRINRAWKGKPGYGRTFYTSSEVWGIISNGEINADK